MKFQVANPQTASPPPRSYWVVENQLLAGAYPGSSDPGTHRAKIQTLLENGIRTFINLTESDETNHHGELFVPYEPLVTQLCPEASCMRFPVRDLGIPTTIVMDCVLDAIDESLARHRPVYVHCWGGVGRTGTVVACWLLRHDLVTVNNFGEVLAKLRQQDLECGDRPWPESPRQRTFMDRWCNSPD